ncbi:MAG: UDP-galactopyranose mutase [Proteobacteria bacterium]|jgi:UDP-galactopyranose mutase|nr:UDP-galactopyranose mutase [Pseudomonadota bacterium]
MYDYLIVGSGLFGSTFARKAKDAGQSVLVIEKEKHVGGHVRTEIMDGIIVSLFGPHIFHTKHKHVWDFVNKFSEFNHYRHQVKANYNGKIISLPFNMMTFHQLWGCITPADVEAELAKRQIPIDNPQNMEEWCLSQLGEEIYHTLIYHYTKKQWNRDPKTLPASIIKRLPIRMSYDESYFDDPYQGMPIHGYTPLVEKMLDGIAVQLGTDFKEIKNDWRKIGKKLVYSGKIDEFFDFCYGELDYRTIDFQTTVLDGNFQGVAQMNHTGELPVYTRTIEHKHFYFINSPKTVITYEFSQAATNTSAPDYPVIDDKNKKISGLYKAMQSPDILFGGRLGTHSYLNMDDCIDMALRLSSFI